MSATCRTWWPTAYIAAAEAKQTKERRAVDADSELGLWLAWARHKADGEEQDEEEQDA